MSGTGVEDSNFTYSMGAQCGAEIVGTMIAIYIGESAIANSKLYSSKGSQMGWLAESLAMGLGFGFSIWCFSYISAVFNPAMTLALWVTGQYSGLEFLALSASQFLGAFLGACLVFVHAMPHFQMVPTPTLQGGFTKGCCTRGLSGRLLSRRHGFGPGSKTMAALAKDARHSSSEDDAAHAAEHGDLSPPASPGARAGATTTCCGPIQLTEGDSVFQAAIKADQAAKLGVFCTGPAIRNTFHNLLCEFMCTILLLWVILEIDARKSLLVGQAKAGFLATEGLAIGLYIFVAILAMGGPTGIAANPARDLAPRFAHWVLPIPGKGDSNWGYAWIPVLAPFAGGAATGGLFLLWQKLNHSNLP